MKTQQTKKFRSAFLPAIFFISILIFSYGCSKETGKTSGSDIVYTDVVPDSVIVNSTLQKDSFKLDLNNDGVIDFEFDRGDVVLCNDYWTGTVGHATFLSLKPTSGSNAIMTSGANLALAIDSLKRIAPDSQWVTTSQILLHGPIYLTGPLSINIRWALDECFG